MSREADPERLAIHGGHPVRDITLPYGRQTIDEDDVRAVTDALRSDWLTTGPRVGEFERAFAATVGGPTLAVAVSNGTAALHTAMHALDVRPGDEVIVPPLTFAATANAVLYQGATPVFADVDPRTLLLDPDAAERAITPRTKAIVGVDYAGQPCDWARLREVARRHAGVRLVADACHALGATREGERVGAMADLSTFSFHPVKHVATGEGGMVTTADPALASRMRTFRNHGITTDHRERAQRGSWHYEMTELGYNYRLSDVQCALGISQLAKLPASLARRRAIAAQYDKALGALRGFRPLEVAPTVAHAYHLYVVRVDPTALHATRDEVFAALRAEGIGVNVHYPPVHLHPYYRDHRGTREGMFPHAEQAAREVLSLPMFPAMTDRDVADVLRALEKVARAFQR